RDQGRGPQDQKRQYSLIHRGPRQRLSQWGVTAPAQIRPAATDAPVTCSWPSTTTRHGRAMSPGAPRGHCGIAPGPVACTGCGYAAKLAPYIRGTNMHSIHWWACNCPEAAVPLRDRTAYDHSARPVV